MILSRLLGAHNNLTRIRPCSDTYLHLFSHVDMYFNIFIYVGTYLYSTKPSTTSQPANSRSVYRKCSGLLGLLETRLRVTIA